MPDGRLGMLCALHACRFSLLVDLAYVHRLVPGIFVHAKPVLLYIDGENLICGFATQVSSTTFIPCLPNELEDQNPESLKVVGLSACKLLPAGMLCFLFLSSL